MSNTSNKNKTILIIAPAIKGASLKTNLYIKKYSQDKYNYIAFTLDEKCNNNHFDKTFFYEGKSKDSRFTKRIKMVFKQTRQLKKIISNEGVDSVIGWYKRGGVLAAIAGLITQTKSIVAVRNNPKRKFENLSGKITAFLYRFADLVVTNSKKAEKICNKKYNIKNTKTIYNPVDYEKIQEKIKEPLAEKYKNIFNSGYTFINIGRLTSQKGQWHLIRAFKKVVKAHPDAKLVILGDGYLISKLEKLIEKCGLENNVFLLGHQDNVFSYLSSSDCFVLSSLHEGLPNAILEAKTVGLPIIATDCDTGPREILAPKLDVTADISYPHKADKHVVIGPLSGNQIFQSPENKSLEDSERMLARVMKSKINKKQKNKKFNRDSRFEPEKTANEWLKLF